MMRLSLVPLMVSLVACGPGNGPLDAIDREDIGVAFSHDLIGTSLMGSHLVALKSQRLLIWSVGPRGELESVSRFSLPGVTTDRGGEAMAVVGQRAWVWYRGRIWLVDLSTPAQPVVLKSATYDTSNGSVEPATVMGSLLAIDEGGLVDLADEAAAWATLTGPRFRSPVSYYPVTKTRLMFRSSGRTVEVARVGATPADGWASLGTTTLDIEVATTWFAGANETNVWLCQDDIAGGTPGLHRLSIGADGTLSSKTTTIRKDGCRGRVENGVAWVYSRPSLVTGRKLEAWHANTGATLAQLSQQLTVAEAETGPNYELRLVSATAAYVESQSGLLVMSPVPRP